jgi:biofilm PGA synthesis lipoprotein PgaB
MERAADRAAFFRDLVAAVERRGAMKRVVFELQTVDWRDGNRPIPTEELAETILALHAMGVRHVGYYPDVLFREHPDARVLRPAIDALRGVGKVH